MFSEMLNVSQLAMHELELAIKYGMPIAMKQFDMVKCVICILISFDFSSTIL